MCNRRRRCAAAFAADAGGMAAIEFALISPVFILLLLGAIQVGWAVHNAASVRWALEASARSLMINPSLTENDVRTAMLAKLSKVADADDIEVSITPDADEESLVVESTYTSELTLPIVPMDSLTFNYRVTVPTLGGGS